MRNTLKSSAAGALCAALAVTALPSEAWAGPTSVSGPSVAGLSSPVENVRYRRHHLHRHWARHYYYRYGYDPGAAALGTALGVLGAAALYHHHHHYYGYGYPYYGYGYPYYGYGLGYPYYGY